MNKADYSRQLGEFLIMRNQRKSVAYEKHMGEEYKTSPLSTLDFLEKSLSKLENIDDVLTKHESEQLEVIRQKIQSGEYCVPGTTEYDYAIKYATKEQTFIWPTDEELELQKEEKKVLINIIEQIHQEDVKRRIASQEINTTVIPIVQRIDGSVENYTELRYDICKSCEHFISLTTQCKKCGCIMKLKTMLAGAHCPVNKW